ncbi:DnaJ domain-containing protein [Haliea sp. E1-2-M8]|uniref:DnaJ domain-containing protein n=1 Tax=Haliea sp. E1-2-M8 TaxID=3064706 RepID=UPI0027218A81|nr:DnaJ domain-containing protein [Haliea sp. E1-2-M8]MDO8862232.1 DnaJ domain-containing protein [Haliea sp. E1-2-M8]
MPKLLLLLAIALALYILFIRAQALPPHQRKAQYLKLGIVIAVGAVVFLTLTGRMHWVGAALTGLLVGARQLLPLLIRLFPMLSSLRNKASAAGPGQHSTVESAILRMHLDHESGKLSGEVLRGPLQDWRLDELDRSQLEDLLRYCQQEDNDSVQLLLSYLEQRFPGEADFGRQQQAAPDTGSGLSRAEALAVLGLEDNASDEDIVQAHRKLMQKLHPDRGGNDYLAAKVNQAKDFLLG